MIQKSMLVELIKEVLAENPNLASSSCGSSQASTRKSYNAIEVNKQNGQFGALEQLAKLAEQQRKSEVARYLYLAIEADTLPENVMKKISLAKIPFEMTKQELLDLAQQLQHSYQAPYHAAMVSELLQRFTSKHCLKRSYQY
ncbi:MAG: diol dehydratase small subunit [Bacillota bacterium]|nr:diol dehydratase small subunit [Bacillota bacterium]